MLNLSWIKCQSGNWCSFATVDLSEVKAEGVYIIWHGGDKPKVVRVGQGKVADRIAAHRNDRAITAYSSLGLYVTWAAVPAAQRDGVERYLADCYSPLVGDAFPNVLPIAVNLL
jgi:hypothetical protein